MGDETKNKRNGLTDTTSVMAHIQEPPPRPRRFNAELPSDVEVVILKALAKKRASRFESVRAMKDTYQAALSGQALPEFDGVPVGPTVRLPSRAAEEVDAALPPTTRRRSIPWAAIILIPILGAAAFFFGLLSVRTRDALRSSTVVSYAVRPKSSIGESDP